MFTRHLSDVLVLIEKLGAEVKGYQLGDRVTFDSTIYNPHSFFSKRGMINLCDDRKVLGVSCEDYRQHGAFAELVSVGRICQGRFASWA